MIFIKIIDVIGYSGSGKTYFIMTAVKCIKEQLNYNVSVIKNVKHHQIDEKGKDSHKFTEAGASYSIIKNDNNDVAIFLNTNDNGISKLISWLQSGPYNVDLLFTEGFRNFDHPTILCVSDLEEIKPQLNNNVKMISGIICQKPMKRYNLTTPPIINIEKNFQKFMEIFKIM